MSVDVNRLALKLEFDQALADWEAAPEWYRELPFLGHIACADAPQENLVPTSQQTQDH